MKIEKEIISKIEREYFFIEGTLDLDGKYFINKIEEGIKDSSLSHKTNVLGFMTSWDFFNNDEKFNFVLNQIADYLEDRPITKYTIRLKDTWGIKESHGHFTKRHDHVPSYMSGIIYLNDHTQKLYFPDINQHIIPQCGKFIVFSSFLKHYTKRNLTNESKYALSFNCE